jgi:hypothetical protein
MNALFGHLPDDISILLRLRRDPGDCTSPGDVAWEPGADLALVDWRMFDGRRVEPIGDHQWQDIVADHLEPHAAEVVGMKPFADRLIERARVAPVVVFEQRVIIALATMKEGLLQATYVRLTTEAQLRAITGLRKAVEAERKDDDSDSGGTADEGPAEHLLAIARATVTLHLDHFGDVYARYEVKRGGDSYLETSPIRSAAFRGHMRRLYNRKHRKVASDNAITSTLGTLEAFALEECEPEPVFIRTACVTGADGAKTIYIDIGDRHRRAIKVTNQAWEIVSAPPVLFYRPPTFAALPIPVHCDTKGGLDELFKLIRVKDERSKRVLVAVLHQALGGEGEDPVLNITGAPGATKTSLA